MRSDILEQTDSDYFKQLFRQYTDVLLRYRCYWQLASFHQTQLPWQQHPALHAYLQQFHQQQETPSETSLRTFFPALQCLPTMTAIASAAESDIRTSEARWPFWIRVGIGGRKLAQITAFIDAIPAPSSTYSAVPAPADVLEWCAGKGHLGRLLSFQRRQSVTSVEWQSQLCQQGQQLAQQHDLAQQFITHDVLSCDSQGLLQGHAQALALHACGQLHTRLMQQAVCAQTEQLHIAPCCYHLIDTERYQPLSQTAQQQDLQLSRLDLKLAVRGVVTGGARAQRLRQRELLWRMSYQCWREAVYADAQYYPLATLRAAQLQGEFSDFVGWAARQQGLPLPATIASEELLQQGAARAALVAQIESVQQLFQQPLELWLLLDRVIFLQEQGYQTSLRRFCSPQLTPRNWLIQAYRSAPA